MTSPALRVAGARVPHVHRQRRRLRGDRDVSRAGLRGPAEPGDLRYLNISHYISIFYILLYFSRWLKCSCSHLDYPLKYSRLTSISLTAYSVLSSIVLSVGARPPLRSLNLSRALRISAIQVFMEGRTSRIAPAVAIMIYNSHLH